MQPMKTLLIMLCATTLVFAQEEPKVLFQTQDIIPIQISFSNRDLKKNDNDTIFFDIPEPRRAAHRRADRPRDG